MTIDRRTLLGAAAGMTLAGPALAQQSSESGPVPAADAPDRPTWPPRETFPLWPDGAPGAPAALPKPHNMMFGPKGERQLWLFGIPEAFVAVYRPAVADGRSVMAIPGGGYSFVAVQDEGIDVAHRLNAQGITVFVLVYRLPGEGWAERWNVPLQDAQRAMRLIRSRSGEYGIDPAKLGIVGFSAGGHLAASLTVGYDDKVYAPRDAADQQSAKPAFSGLIYPVIDLSFGPNGDTTHHLFGDDTPADAKARYETSRRVTAQTPAIFLAQALDDPTVNPQNTINMLLAARAAKIAAEAHFFEKGGHGFGVQHIAPGLTTNLWPDLFERWIAMQVGDGQRPA